jgi:hypothetical protein
MGLREPFHDWSVAHGICPKCLKRITPYLPPDLKKQVEEGPPDRPADQGAEPKDKGH